MRVARQHPLHLQVTRRNNGKFVVNQSHSVINNGNNIDNNDNNIQQRDVINEREANGGGGGAGIRGGGGGGGGGGDEDGIVQDRQQLHYNNSNEIINNVNVEDVNESLQNNYHLLQLQQQQQYQHHIQQQQLQFQLQLQNELLLQQRRREEEEEGERQLRQQQQQQQQPQRNVVSNDEEATTTAAVVNHLKSCETLQQQETINNGPTLLGDRFLLIGKTEGSALIKCVDVKTGQQLVAKALTMGDKGGQALLEAHLRLDGTGAVSGIAGVVDAPRGRRYLLLEGHHGDLHAYVRARRRLREPEARRLFRQAAKAVYTCHENGVVLRDLKLRKFVFADEARTKLRLESLEDAVMVENDDDKLADRRGCPAYVAPEVLRSGRAYSGKAADIWSLGVLLYTMLVGRYPFNDPEHSTLFAKISRGLFNVPDSLTNRAKCLVKNLLRKEPDERPHSQDVIKHPWLTKPIYYSQNNSHNNNHSNSNNNNNNNNAANRSNNDQVVPIFLSNPSSSSSTSFSSSSSFSLSSFSSQD